MDVLKPIETVQLSDRTYDQLREAIVTIDLKPGEVLKDRNLADRLGVSRTPVREALHRLEAIGLVEPRGRAGYVVASFTERDVHELFELRRLLEPAGLDRLAKTLDDDAIARLGHSFEPFDHPVRSDRFPEYFKADHSFHKLLVACSGNQRIQRFYGIVEDHIDRGRHLLSTGVADRVDETLAEHRAIVDAVLDRDFDRARVELLRHLHTGEVLMTNQLQRLMENSD